MCRTSTRPSRLRARPLTRAPGRASEGWSALVLHAAPASGSDHLNLRTTACVLTSSYMLLGSCFSRDLMFSCGPAGRARCAKTCCDMQTPQTPPHITLPAFSMLHRCNALPNDRVSCSAKVLASQTHAVRRSAGAGTHHRQVHGATRCSWLACHCRRSRLMGCVPVLLTHAPLGAPNFSQTELLQKLWEDNMEELATLEALVCRRSSILCSSGDMCMSGFAHCMADPCTQNPNKCMDGTQQQHRCARSSWGPGVCGAAHSVWEFLLTGPYRHARPGFGQAHQAGARGGRPLVR